MYTLGATGIVNALDAGTGAVVWSRNAASDTGAQDPGWGFTSSPLVVNDLVIVAVPIGAGQTCAEIASVADELVCAQTPDPFIAVGVWYRDFTPTTDDQVRQLLAGSRARHAG